MWWGVSVTPRPLITLGKTRYPLYRRLGGPQGLSGQVRKIASSTGIRSPDRPAPSQLLYQLNVVCSKNKAMAEGRGRGLAREFMAIYYITRTYIMYLMLQLRVSIAVTLYIVHFFMASGGDKFTFPFHLPRKDFISFLGKFNKTFNSKVSLPKIFTFVK
jgi:hypothetical protein